MALDDFSIFQQEPLHEGLLKLENLLTQTDRAVLLGAGASKCAGLPLTAELTEIVLGDQDLGASTKEILTGIRDSFAGADSANIEDFLSELIDLLAIVERRGIRGADKVEVPVGQKEYGKSELQAAVTEIKRGIAKAIEKPVSIDTHRHFIRALHMPQRPGKHFRGKPVDYLVLNYDTVIEDALSLERVSFADGIDGGVTGWWNPSTFDTAGLLARVFKLHGSINWCELADDPLPRRMSPTLQLDSPSDRRILIWPASTKYRETQMDPFAQLLARTRRVLRPTEGEQRVLFICGYGFGDDHVNSELDRALRESSGDLTIAVFTGSDNPNGFLKTWHEDADIRDQVLIYAKHGFFHADQVVKSTEELPWWKFENIARLFGGER